MYILNKEIVAKSNDLGRDYEHVQVSYSFWLMNWDILDGNQGYW